MIPSLDFLWPGAGWLSGTLIKVTVLLVAAAALAVGLRRASAAARHLIWSAAIVTALAVPPLTALMPWRLPVIRVAAPTATVAPVASAESGAPVEAGARVEPGLRAATATPVETAVPAEAAAPAVSPVTVVTAVWLAGVLLLLLRLAIGTGFLARVARRAMPLTAPDWMRPLLEGADRLGLARAPRLLMSDRLPMPYTTGFVRPVIVLPESAGEWDERRRRAVLFHELAHLRRLDLVLNGFAQLACALWWFHPLVWVAARKLRTESERACDDLVLGVGTRASEYADHLLHIVCGALRARTPAVALPMAQQHEFEGRMLAILDRDARRGQPSRRHATLVGALALGIVLPVAALGTATAKRVPPPEPSAMTGPAVDDQPQSVTADEPRIPRPEVRSAPPTDAAMNETANTDATPIGAAVERLQQDTGAARVVAALIKALDDPEARVRRDAAYALGNREAPSAVNALAARLTGDPSGDVRETAAWSLGQIESPAATAALSAAAKRDSSVEVRGTAVWALGQIEDPQSVPALAAVLVDPSPEVRGRAAWALGSIGARPAPDALVAALRDTSSSVRLRAAWALGQIEDPAAVTALVAAFDDPDADVRKAAFWAAAQMPEAGAEPALLKALEHEDPEIRALAARALGGGHLDPWPWPWPWPR